jgi:hypothetical protein
MSSHRVSFKSILMLSGGDVYRAPPFTYRFGHNMNILAKRKPIEISVGGVHPSRHPHSHVTAFVIGPNFRLVSFAETLPNCVLSFMSGSISRSYRAADKM